MNAANWKVLLSRAGVAKVQMLRDGLIWRLHYLPSPIYAVALFIFRASLKKTRWSLTLARLNFFDGFRGVQAERPGWKTILTSVFSKTSPLKCFFFTLLWWCAALETILMMINVENSLIFLVKPWYIFLFRILWCIGGSKGECLFKRSVYLV